MWIMSDEEFGNMVKSIVEDLAVDAVARASDGSDGGKAPSKGRAKGDARVVHCAARFSDEGGSLDCRRGGNFKAPG